MIIFSNVEAILEELKVVQVTSYDKTNHFQIFSSLLRFAGYNGSWVRTHYGASLSDPPGTLPEFFVGDLHGRGSVRQWVSIYPTEAESD
jgi:hypothetical protein